MPKVGCPQRSTQAQLEYHARLLERQDTLKHFKPVGIIKLNVNSNLGLCQIMRNHFMEHKQNTDNLCSRYSTWNVDIAIYRRILKVTNPAHTHKHKHPKLILILHIPNS